MSEELGLLCKDLVKRSSVGLAPFELRCRCACFQVQLRRIVSAMCCDVWPCEGWATWGSAGLHASDGHGAGGVWTYNTALQTGPRPQQSLLLLLLCFPLRCCQHLLRLKSSVLHNNNIVQ